MQHAVTSASVLLCTLVRYSGMMLEPVARFAKPVTPLASQTTQNEVF